jgi:hypothetical protein
MRIIATLAISQNRQKKTLLRGAVFILAQMQIEYSYPLQGGKPLEGSFNFQHCFECFEYFFTGQK